MVFRIKENLKKKKNNDGELATIKYPIEALRIEQINRFGEVSYRNTSSLTRI